MPRRSTSKTIRPREKEIAKLCNDWLRLHGITPYRRNITKVKFEHKGKTYWVKCGEPGQSDWWFILSNARHAGGMGVHCEVEYKRPGAWPNQEQIYWMININKQGGIAFWVSSLLHLEMVYSHINKGGRISMNLDGTYEII
jgi:hypothetical protein